MLQIIREKAQGVVAWTIVAMIAITFTLWGVGDYFSSNNSKSYAAKVNGVLLSWKVVNDIYDQVIQQYFSSNDLEYSKIDAVKIKTEIRDALAQRIAVVAAAEKYGFNIRDEQLKEVVRGTSDFQENGVFSVDKYRNFLRAASISEADYQMQIRQTLLVEALQGGILMSSFSFKQEADKLYDIVQQRRDFGYAIIPASKYQATIKISEEEMQDYYAKNKDSFITDEQVSIEYIKVSLDDLLNKVSIEEDELLDYYKQNSQHYVTKEQINIRHILVRAPKGTDLVKSGESREKADDLLARLKTGAKFSDLAKQFSQDSESAPKGGDLGWITEQDADTTFVAAAFALKNPGDLSQVVQTDFGYHIIQLIARQESRVKSFAEIKTALEAEFKRTKARDLLLHNFDELNKLAVEGQQQLELVAKQLDLELKITAAFTKQKIPAELNSKVALEAFSADLIDGGQNSELIRVDDETAVVLKVDKHIMPYQLDFAAAKPEIAGLLVSRGAKEKARQDADDFINKLADGILPFNLAKDNNVDWIVKNDIGRGGSRDLPIEITKKIFAMKKPSNDKSIYDLLSLANGDYVVLALQNVSAAVVASADLEVASNINAQITQGLGQYEYSLFEQMIVANTKMILPTINN